MVKPLLALGRTGLQDWFIQRVSAYVLAAYVFFWVIWFFASGEITYLDWQRLFDNVWLRCFSLLAGVSLLLHAWIGLWIILTDYVKSPGLRGSLQMVVGLTAVFYLGWLTCILWDPLL